MNGLESAEKTQQYSSEQSRIRYEMMKFEADAKRREAELTLKSSELSLEKAENSITSSATRRSALHSHRFCF